MEINVEHTVRTKGSVVLLVLLPVAISFFISK